MHATPVFVSLPCPGVQTLRIQIDQRVKAAQFVTELGSNSQLHAIKLDEHAYEKRRPALDSHRGGQRNRSC